MSEERDERLSRLLRSWGPPAIPEDLDARVLSAYRRRTRSPWRRLLRAEIRVPVPVAAVVILLLLLSTALALRPASRGTAATPAATAGEPVRAARRVEPAVASHTTLAGFRPVEELQATVVQERTP